MSISNLVRVYLKNKPYTLESLEKGIINYSALARSIQGELKIKNHYAVKAALIRYAQQIRKSTGGIEERAMEILKENRITLLDGIFVIISDVKLSIENDAEVKIDRYYVYLTRKNSFRTLTYKSKNNFVKVHENCSAIIIHSEARLENVSGVMAFLTSVLAEQNINLIELISCYTETILVINREDALRSYEILSAIIK